MKFKYFVFSLIYFLGVIYLVLPTPETPELSNAIRSDEPGDTWQHPEQKGFYTNMTRAQVIEETQSKFVTKIFGLSIPSYRLNYRPEESFEFVRDQVPSNYLEEIVYPMKSSLFVSGWEPVNAPINRNIDPKYLPGNLYKGIYYLSKVTLRPVSSPPYAGILIWTLIFPSIYLVIKFLKKSLKDD